MRLKFYCLKLFFTLLTCVTLIALALNFRLYKHIFGSGREEANIVQIQTDIKRDSRNTLWFFKQKAVKVRQGASKAALFFKDDPLSDRIVNQLLYVPPNYNRNISMYYYKKIFLHDGPLSSTEQKLGSSYFENCPVSTCTVVDKIYNSDLVIYRYNPPNRAQNKNQIRMIYSLESPVHFSLKRGSYDWTSTYRRDSDIVAPYGKWEYYDDRITQIEQPINYAKNKTKQVAWFVSNCFTINKRFEFAKKLNEFIEVDIYGLCGDLACPKTSKDCFDFLQHDYKFYLSFENSNCKDYITEKIFDNALQNNIIPIVMGANIEDYRKHAPEKSFIHIDEFETIEHLATYLKLLDNDDSLYNSYFKWKGTGEFINTYYWCRVCAMLHIPDKDVTKYSLSKKTFNSWWNSKGICTNDMRKFNLKSKLDSFKKQFDVKQALYSLLKDIKQESIVLYD